MAGAQYHVARRHFLGMEIVAPFQLGDGELKYELGPSTIHSSKAPSSFGESKVPHLMATYDYRLFDRIDLGIGVSVWHGDYFATTPEAIIDSLGPIRLESDGSGAWLEMHIGWTFGSARP